MLTYITFSVLGENTTTTITQQQQQPVFGTIVCPVFVENEHIRNTQCLEEMLTFLIKDQFLMRN